MSKRKIDACAVCGAEFKSKTLRFESPTNGAIICGWCYSDYAEHAPVFDGRCVGCGDNMIRRGVMLLGNVLTGEASRPVERYECPYCDVIESVEIEDQEAGWAEWEKQGNKRS